MRSSLHTKYLPWLEVLGCPARWALGAVLQCSFPVAADDLLGPLGPLLLKSAECSNTLTLLRCLVGLGMIRLRPLLRHRWPPWRRAHHWPHGLCPCGRAFHGCHTSGSSSQPAFKRTNKPPTSTDSHHLHVANASFCLALSWGRQQSILFLLWLSSKRGARASPSPAPHVFRPFSEAYRCRPRFRAQPSPATREHQPATQL